MAEIFKIDIAKDVPGIFILEKRPQGKFLKYKMPNFESLNLDSLIEFERDMEMGNIKPHLKSQSEDHEHKLPGKMVPMTAKSISTIIDGNKTLVGNAHYLLLYQGYESWPSHHSLMELIGKMSESSPYQENIAFAFKSLNHNEGVHFEEECLTLFDLRHSSISKLDLTTDLDHHEIDQWLRMKVHEITFADHTDL